MSIGEVQNPIQIKQHIDSSKPAAVHNVTKDELRDVYGYPDERNAASPEEMLAIVFEKLNSQASQAEPIPEDLPDLCPHEQVKCVVKVDDQGNGTMWLVNEQTGEMIDYNLANAIDSAIFPEVNKEGSGIEGWSSGNFSTGLTDLGTAGRLRVEGGKVVVTYGFREHEIRVPVDMLVEKINQVLSEEQGGQQAAATPEATQSNDSILEVEQVTSTQAAEEIISGQPMDETSPVVLVEADDGSGVSILMVGASGAIVVGIGVWAVTRTSKGGNRQNVSGIGIPGIDPFVETPPQARAISKPGIQSVNPLSRQTSLTLGDGTITEGTIRQAAKAAKTSPRSVRGEPVTGRREYDRESRIRRIEAASFQDKSSLDKRNAAQPTLEDATPGITNRQKGDLASARPQGSRVDSRPDLRALRRLPPSRAKGPSQKDISRKRELDDQYKPNLTRRQERGLFKPPFARSLLKLLGF